MSNMNPDTQQLLAAVDQLIDQWKNYDNTGPLPADEIMDRITTIREGQKKDQHERKALDLIAMRAFRFLTRIDHITTDDFSKGGDKAEREALRVALQAVGL